MDLDKIAQLLGFNPVAIFREAVDAQFFGQHIFESANESYYQFTEEENEDAVWIARDTSGESLFRVIQVEASRIQLGQVVPGPVSLQHCKRIVETWIEDRKHSRIQREMRDGGKEFAEIANSAFLDVLMTSVLDDNKIQVEGHQLDDLLSQLFSDMRKRDLRLDIFIFPEHLRALLLQRGIITPNSEIQNRRYVGETIAGQKAFWASEMPVDTAIIVASEVGFTLMGDLDVGLIRDTSSGWPIPAVCGHRSINPIVKDRRGVLVIEGLEEGLASGAVRALAAAQRQIDVMYVNPERLDELKGISSRYDLGKLIRLCEELNTCYASGCFLATAALTRAILDHVPPIFSFGSFREVANNYSGGGRSFSRQMQHLENSSRHIADRYLHTQARSSESLPTQTEVNFRNDLDTLLGEIARILS